jgi:hypothetical protein
MKDLQILEVKQIRIFAADALPLASLINRRAGKTFVERFGWGEMNASAPGEIRFGTGLFPSADAPITTVVKGLEISERKVALTVIGDTATAATVYAGITEFLAQETGQEAWKAAPLVLTHETQCVATCDFDWSALVGPPFTSFVTGELLRGLSSRDGQATIASLKLGFELRYTEIRSDLQEHGITLANKAFVIEPRAGTPLSERRFFSTSPTDSETHMRLLRNLEEAVTKRRGHS